MSFSICFGTFNGLGRHESDVPDGWQSVLKKSQYTFSVLYVRARRILEVPEQTNVLTCAEPCTHGGENVDIGLLPEPITDQ